MADQVLDVGVSLDIKPVDVDGSRNGYLRQVVSHQVNQHPMFGPLFLITDHGFSMASRLVGGRTLWAGPFDG